MGGSLNTKVYDTGRSKSGSTSVPQALVSLLLVVQVAVVIIVVS